MEAKTGSLKLRPNESITDCGEASSSLFWLVGVSVTAGNDLVVRNFNQANASDLCGEGQRLQYIS